MSKNSRCPKCRELVKGSCDKCKESKRLSQQRRRERLKKLELCVCCGKRPTTNGMCKICKNKTKVTAQKRNGDCAVCGANRTEREFIKSKNLCKKCGASKAKENRSKNYDKYAARGKEWTSSNALNWLRVRLINIKSGKRNRHKNREITITIDDLMLLFKKQNGNCAITGVKMTHSPGLKAISVDRIDSNLDYTNNNIQLVCKAINLGKNTHSNSEMISFINEVVVCGDKNTITTENKNGYHH
jgi:hypothetical protein